MNTLYLLTIILGITFQNVIKKPYTRRASGKGVYLFSLLSGFAAMLFFMLTSKGFQWNVELIPYAIAFALSYSAANVFTVLAVAHGSLSVSSLIISYSLMIPTAYGLIFLKDPMGAGFIIGLILLAVSLFLTNGKNDASPVTLKWLICVFLAFVGNGMSSVIQKMQQLAFDGGYKNEFMIISLAISSVVLLLAVAVKERRVVRLAARAGWHMAIGCGVANGLVNLFVMILSGRMSVALMFPLISAGGIVMTYFISRYLYKERLTKKQLTGFIIGVASVVILNL